MKSSATVAASIGPPAPAEEQIKKRDIEDVKVEGTKRNENEDAMDVEPIPAQPPLEDTIKHPNEHLLRYPTPTPTDRKEAEDAPHAH